MSKFDWEFTPFKGIGHLNFGDTREEVRRKMKELFREERKEKKIYVKFINSESEQVVIDHFTKAELEVTYTNEDRACQFLFFAYPYDESFDTDLERYLCTVDYKIQFISNINLLGISANQILQIAEENNLKITGQSYEFIDLGDIGLEFCFEDLTSCPYPQAILLVDLKQVII
jgi:hypothetical protein